jgi:hypothetical protein
MQTKRGDLPQENRPMILDVLPADVAPRLDKIPKSVNKKLINRLLKRHFGWWISVAVVVIIAGAVTFIWQPWQSSGAKLPSALTEEISGFVPYYFEAMPKDMTVVEKTLSYSDGVLFFQIQNNNGKNVVVSEQALPDVFAKSAPQGDEIVDGAEGSAFIADRDGRIVGTLLTDKKPRALISLNTTDGADRGMMKAILQNLKPVQ